MALQSAIALLGVAKQVAKGTEAAEPTFQFGISDGGVFKSDLTQDLADVTSGTRAAPGVDRTEFVPGVDYTQRVHVGSVGLLLYLALGGKAVSGAGPYTHVFTGANTLPYCTWFGTQDGALVSVEDARIDELTLSWDENSPLELQVSGVGCGLAFPSSITPTTDESRTGYLAPAGGTFKLDLDGTSPATAAIKAGEIGIKNGVETVPLSGAITPGDVHPGRREVEVSFTIVPTSNLDDWRTIVTGTNNGTTVKQDALFGSFEITFSDGTNSLEIEALRCAFITEWPDADPSGGAIELEVTGMAVLPLTSGADITATLINSVVSY
ncbi:MAG: phage tail tube protein [Candidatus Nanopelagicales bacterium]